MNPSAVPPMLSAHASLVTFLSPVLEFEDSITVSINIKYGSSCCCHDGDGISLLYMIDTALPLSLTPNLQYVSLGNVSLKTTLLGQVWWHRPLLPALKWQRQADL